MMRWYLYIGTTVAILVACLAIRFNLFYESCATIAAYSMYPLLQVHGTLVRPINQWYIRLKQYESLFHDYTKLCDQYQLLQGTCIAHQATNAYAQDVIQELEWFKKRFDNKHVCIAPIMAVHQTDRQHTMIIEGGTDRGIERDMILLADNLLIGKIVTVYTWYSVAQLITDPTSCIAVSGINSKAHGLVRGTGSHDSLLLERVNHLSPVQEQELLLTSGDGMVVPRGYGVGIVTNYSSDGLYYSGTVKTLINPAELRTCVVINRTQLLKN